jgi:hypothetical protein
MANAPTLTQINNGDTNSASTVMTNLNAIVAWINANVIHLDGAKAMTAQLSGTGAAPVAANDISNKAYVDSVFATEAASRLAADRARLRTGCGIRRAASQTNNNPNLDSVTFDTEDWDSDGFFAPSSTNVTVPAGKGGVYIVQAEFPRPTSTGISKQVWQSYLFLNGAVYCMMGNEFNTEQANFAGTSTKAMSHGTALILLAPGDVLTYRISNTSGNITADKFVFTLTRLSA